MEMKVDQKKIKELRLAKSWSQEELAEKAAVSLRTVQRMELDGSASLKSRRSIADALEVEPTFLDPQPADQQVDEVGDHGGETPKGTTKGDWMDLFAYPGPSSMSNKIRTPLLITLWLGMMITGGLLLLATATLTILSILNPNIPFGQILVASIPLLFIFVICLGLYKFFKGFSSPSSS